ncbi:MAG: hypothetical protein HY401_03045 [Elusimicrobia bacterium]|nr:hypothetical protein [Elusimicrobiota bacterium]
MQKLFKVKKVFILVSIMGLSLLRDSLSAATFCSDSTIPEVFVNFLGTTPRLNRIEDYNAAYGEAQRLGTIARQLGYHNVNFGATSGEMFSFRHRYTACVWFSEDVPIVGSLLHRFEVLAKELKAIIQALVNHPMVTYKELSRVQEVLLSLGAVKE